MKLAPVPCSILEWPIPINIICEGLLLIFVLIMMKKWLLGLGTYPYQGYSTKPYPIYDQNGQNQLKLIPIYDQNSWKTIPLVAAHTYKAHIREYPPGVIYKCKNENKSKEHRIVNQTRLHFTGTICNVDNIFTELLDCEIGNCVKVIP